MTTDAVSQRPAFPLRPIDVLAALLVGEGIAWLGLVTFRSVEIRLLEDISPTQEQMFLVIAFPLLAALGIGLAAWVNRWVSWLFQTAKFCLVGLFNTSIDFAVLNLLIASVGATHGALFSLCKAASFGVAVVNSYAWNRHWTFAPAMVDKRSAGRVLARELLLFLGVTLIGVGVNVTVASVVVNLANASPGVAGVRWANLAAAAALVVSATWDFLTYRYIVFSSRISGTARRMRLPVRGKKMFG